VPPANPRPPIPGSLDYCHRKGVVNRDIKLENTLLQVGAQLVQRTPAFCCCR
jgi:serine/threonine protein kinase